MAYFEQKLTFSLSNSNNSRFYSRSTKTADASFLKMLSMDSPVGFTQDKGLFRVKKKIWGP